MDGIDNSDAPAATRQTLTPLEMACLTAQVPASGNSTIDRIITVGLRYRTATQLLEGLVAAGWSNEDRAVKAALELTDKLLTEFRKTSRRL